MVTALAHAIVLKEVGEWEMSQVNFRRLRTQHSLGSKKLPEGKLAEKLAKGADAVKAVYRFVSYHISILQPRMLSAFDSELPNYDLIVPALLKGGIDGLKEACKLTPGKFSDIPVSR